MSHSGDAFDIDGSVLEGVSTCKIYQAPDVPLALHTVLVLYVLRYICIREAKFFEYRLLSVL